MKVTPAQQAQAINKRVDALFMTSADDCKIDLLHETNTVVISALLVRCEQAGYKTKAKHAQQRLNQLAKDAKAHH